MLERPGVGFAHHPPGTQTPALDHRLAVAGQQVMPGRQRSALGAAAIGAGRGSQRTSLHHLAGVSRRQSGTNALRWRSRCSERCRGRAGGRRRWSRRSRRCPRPRACAGSSGRSRRTAPPIPRAREPRSGSSQKRSLSSPILRVPQRPPRRPVRPAGWRSVRPCGPSGRRPCWWSISVPPPSPRPSGKNGKSLAASSTCSAVPVSPRRSSKAAVNSPDHFGRVARRVDGHEDRLDLRGELRLCLLELREALHHRAGRRAGRHRGNRRNRSRARGTCRRSRPSARSGRAVDQFERSPDRGARQRRCPGGGSRCRIRKSRAMGTEGKRNGHAA